MDSPRALYVAWRSHLEENYDWGVVGQLSYSETDGMYSFGYTRGAKALDCFVPFPGMSDLESVYCSFELFPTFANRLMSPKRPDFREYLSWLDFAEDENPPPLAVLGISEGLRQTDSVELFPCPKPVAGKYENKFFVHGIRYREEGADEQIRKLQEKENLTLVPEDNNLHDPNAVAIYANGANGTKIGFVPRYMTHDVRYLLECNGTQEVQVTVVRVNPTAPTQLRLICQLQTSWPADFCPCSEDAYQPLAEINERQLV